VCLRMTPQAKGVRGLSYSNHCGPEGGRGQCVVRAQWSGSFAMPRVRGSAEVIERRFRTYDWKSAVSKYASEVVSLMAQPRKPARNNSFLSRKEMAAVFDVSVAYFNRELRPLFDAKHVHQSDGCLSFYSRGCVECWARAKFKTQPSERSDDAILEDYLLLRHLG